MILKHNQPVFVSKVLAGIVALAIILQGSAFIIPTIADADTGTTTQTITFNPLADQTYGASDFDVSASSDSGLPVSFISFGNCTVSGTSVHLDTAGECSIGAQQAGDSTYAAAPNAVQSFAINKANLSINGDGADKVYDGTTTATISHYWLNTVFNNDNVAVTSADAQFTDPSVGGPKGITVTDIVLGGANASNYTYNTNFNSSGTILAATSTATTTPIVHTITASAGTGGSISPSGAVSVNDGSNQSFAIIASSSFHIASVIVDGLSVGTSSAFTFSNVGANNTISAAFASTTATTTSAASSTSQLTLNTPGAPVGSHAYVSINSATSTEYLGAPFIINNGSTFDVTASMVTGYTVSLSGDCNTTAAGGSDYLCWVVYAANGTSTSTSTINTLSIHPTATISTTTNATSTAVQYSTPAITETDASATSTINCVPSSGSLFALGTTTVICSASDSNGNATSSTFKIIVSATTTATTTPPTATSTATLQIGIPNAPYNSAALISINGATPISTTTSYVDPLRINNGDHFSVTGPVVAGYNLSASGDCDLIAVGGTSYYCSLNYTTNGSAIWNASSTAQLVIGIPNAPIGSAALVSINGGTAISTTTSYVDPLIVNAGDSFNATGNILAGYDLTTSGDCSIPNAAGATQYVCLLVYTANGSSTNPLTISPVSDIATTTSSTSPSIAINYTLPTATSTATTTNGIATTSISCIPTSGSLFTIGTTTSVMCSASDSAGNTATSTFNINVSTTTTNDPAIVSAATNAISFSGGGGGGVAFGGSSSNDDNSSTMTTQSTTSPTVANTLSCPFLTSYVIPGRTNSPAAVAQLQLFLNLYTNTNLAVNGVLDANTIAAVKAFQASHMSDVMGPWGLNKSSGQTYITTVKEINSIVCGSSKTLTPAELVIINAYKARFDQRKPATAPTVRTTVSTSTPTIAPTVVPVVSSSSAPTSIATTTDNSLLVGNALSSQGGSGFLNSIFSTIGGWFK